MEQLLAWERLLKRIVWLQLGEIKGKKILDFGSGLGVTADRNDTTWQEKMIQIEMRVSEVEAFRAVAFFHHILLGKEAWIQQGAAENK